VDVAGRNPAAEGSHQHPWWISSASFASEVTRVAREVGTDGKLGGQAIVPASPGRGKTSPTSVNAMCGTSPHRS